MFKFILILLFCLSLHNTSAHTLEIKLPKITPKKTQLYDFKYQMKDQYYFKGDVTNWGSLKFKMQFIVPSKWGTIYFNLYLPALVPKPIGFH